MSSGVIVFIQNYLTDPPHLMASWLEELGFEIRTLRPFDGDAIPETFEKDVVAVIALGGAMGALDDHVAPWLAPERALLKSLVEAGRPVLGICLGAQLLGAALGGTVSRLEYNEIGLYSIYQVEDDAIMSVGAGTPATQWHEDYVSHLPSGATLIAASETCPTQIYKVGPLSYGIQCHPEADASIVKLWEAKPDNAFKSFGQKLVSDSIEAAEPELAHHWKPIIQRWGQALLAH